MRKFKSVLFSVFFVFSALSLQAAYLRNIPQKVIQPDGDTLYCFTSGDEFFNYLHDKAGYTIIQNPATGYYVYAERSGDEIVPSRYIAGCVDPASVGLTPGILISPDKWTRQRERRLRSLHKLEKIKKQDRAPASHSAVSDRDKPNFANLVVFIRFRNEPEFSVSLDNITQIFNDKTPGANSLVNYFQNTSYGNLSVSSTFYPTEENKITSYEDIHPIGYFLPWSVSNRDGYNGFDDMMQREYDLVVRAVKYLTSHNIIPPDMDVDLYERDGWVDNVSFIINSSHVQGGILWPHNAVSDDVRIGNNSARVVNYFIMPYQSYKFQVSTLCHEFQHTLTFPDLYHYNSSHYRTPVSNWDLMGYENEERPQQSTAWAKFRYGTSRYSKWIDEPELILDSGTYTLHSVGGNSPDKIACKIPTRDPNQFFIIEYRNQNDLFDKHAKSGLLIYRVDKRFKGNSEYNGMDQLDEIYVFRPGGTATENGDINSALFGGPGRAEFNQKTNPYPFLSDGTRVTDDSWSIENISLKGDIATFFFSGVTFPKNFAKTNSTQNRISLGWELRNDKSVLLVAGKLPVTWMPENGQSYAEGDKVTEGVQVLYTGKNTTFTHSELSPATDYYYRIYSRVSDSPSEWSDKVELIASTECGTVSTYPYFQSFEGSADISACYENQSSSQWSIEQGSPLEVGFNGGTTTAHSGVRNAFVQPGRTGASRLVLPTFNLKDATSAILSFWYTNPGKNSAETDALKVYYRSAVGTNWQEIWSRRSRTYEWTYVELPLQNYTATYQIAFENDPYDGLGVTIDDIRLDAEGVDLPTGTTQPVAQDISVYSHRNKIYIRSAGSLQADIQITDLMGRTVYSGIATEATIIDLHVPAGTYIVRLLSVGAAPTSHKVYLTEE